MQFLENGSVTFSLLSKGARGRASSVGPCPSYGLLFGFLYFLDESSRFLRDSAGPLVSLGLGDLQLLTDNWLRSKAQKPSSRAACHFVSPESGSSHTMCLCLHTVPMAAHICRCSMQATKLQATKKG